MAKAPAAHEAKAEQKRPAGFLTRKGIYDRFLFVGRHCLAEL
jgi:hypothetical protein